MLQHVSVLHSFLWLHNTPQLEYPTFYISSHPLIDIWVVSTFWSLLIRLL